MPVALVRPVPDSFADALTRVPPEPPLDATQARKEHAGYVDALRSGGFEIVEIEPASSHPDSPFVEDVAISSGSRVLLTRPGSETRRGEVAGVRAALEGLMEIDEFGEEGTLDGGDVLQLGGRVLIGLSGRTDRKGLERAAEFFMADGRKVDAVPVRETLHLKSGVSALDDGSVLWHPAACDRAHLDGLTVHEVPGGDPEAANVVRLPDGRILVPGHQGATADLVSRLGFDPVTVEVGEFARADGGLTCLSLRLR